MKNYRIENIQFMLICYGLFGVFFALSFTGLGLLRVNPKHVYLLSAAYLIFVATAIALLWTLFKCFPAKVKPSVSKSGLIFLFMFNVKLLILYVLDAKFKMSFRIIMLDFASTMIFIPYYIAECFKSGQAGWALFKKYGIWFVSFDILFLILRDNVLYFHGHTENQPIYFGLLHIGLLVLFFKLFSQVVDKGLLSPLNWGEYKWYKQLFITIPAVFIGIPCFILFFLFF